MSSCRNSVALFDEKGDSYFLYGSSTEKRRNYCWQNCVTARATLNVLSRI
jgi:hypothetical protein